MILWQWVFWWIAAGMVTAVVIAYINGCFEKKEISLSVGLGMIGVTVMGWIGLMFAISIGLLFGLWLLMEKYGEKPVVKWGKGKEI